MSDAAPDQSVEDVLASIKRVMARDPAPAGAPRRPSRPVAALKSEDVLELTEEADGLASPDTMRATRERLRHLARVERAPEEGTGGGGQTVDALVRELMKPMLKAWLDKNLPAIVDEAVERARGAADHARLRHFGWTLPPFCARQVW